MDALVARTTEAQEGVIHFDQLRALGLGVRAIHARVRAGAAALWEIRPTSSSSIHVTVPAHAGRPHRSRIVVHRSRTLTPDDATVRKGSP